MFRLPDVGEGLTEAEIVGWRVGPGDTVTVNQVLVEIETAKAAVELPSPYAGTVGELLAEAGQTVQVGTPIIAIETAATPGPSAAAPGTDADEEPPQDGAKIGEAGRDGRIATLVGYGPRQGTATRRPRHGGSPGVASPPPRDEPEPPAADPPPAPAAGARDRTVPLAPPPVRKLARELGVDLNTVVASGPHGRIVRADVEAAAASPAGTAPPGGPVPAGSTGEARAARPASTGGTRREPIRGVRKATAAAVVSRAFTAPHVTEFLSVDVTETMELRARMRARPDFDGVKLTPLAFVAKAVCLAAARTPEINATWDEEAGEIVFHDRVQLGIAAATPRGLIVPKVRDADLLGLRAMATALETLTGTARSGRTPPADLVGGTFTITNVGVFGVDTGTPIINPGEAAILALGAIKPTPWVVDGELAVRTVCRLALSFDHRLVDGEQGSRFLADVGALLEDPGVAFTW